MLKPSDLLQLEDETHSTGSDELTAEHVLAQKPHIILIVAPAMLYQDSLTLFLCTCNNDREKTGLELHECKRELIGYSEIAQGTGANFKL